MNHLQPLDKKLRSQLEAAVKKARDIAEEAAKGVLEQLGVGEKNKPTYLDEAQQNLRVRLRAHARSLGDKRSSSGEQGIERLQEEVAYEHWHRMLFSRFLAENHLLMYPDPDDPVAISLEECEDLAADEGATNGWELAGRYASRMLPQIFRVDSPVFELKFAPNHQLDLEKLLINLPIEIFTASDSLGWVYQFWQANNKERINKSEVKIGARELPAVTQLFTEPYMVSFLLDNSLDAWWAARRLSEDDFKNASSEEELRKKAAIDGVPLEYLRFVQDEKGGWSPAAGTFDNWPAQLAELKTLDPCCGSGHFLVSAFLMLVPMRMEQDSLSAQEAVNAVLSQNIHGLELDQRCVELAAFALALIAWKYPRAGGYHELPELHVACSGLTINAKKEEWLALAGDNNSLGIVLEELYKQFKNASVLGSLINPLASLDKGSLFEMKWDEVEPLLTKALAGEKGDEVEEIGVIARGIARAAQIMASTYQLICTNVPYLGRKGHVDELKNFADRFFSSASGDLATLMLERIFQYTSGDGNCFIVLPQNWWVGRSYIQYRKSIVEKRKLILAVTLGEEAWDTFGNRGPNTVLLGVSSSYPPKPHRFPAIDLASKPNKPIITRPEKNVGLQRENDNELGKVFLVSQDDQLNNPDTRISLHPLSSTTTMLLSQYVVSGEGCSTGDADRFLKFHWEVIWDDSWIGYLTPSGKSTPWGGRELLMLWEGGHGELSSSPQAGIKNTELWKRKGILVGRVRGISTTLFDGGAYSKGAVLICPKDDRDLPKIYSFLKSKEYENQVRALDPRVSASTSVLTKVSFDPDVMGEKSLPAKVVTEPIQWLFHGHPCGSVVCDAEQKWTALDSLRSDETVLHIAVARLLGYRWPAELDADMELADEQREWVNRCEALLPLVDEDGIVCIPAVRGEALASDRLINLLAAAYGEEWNPSNLNQLLSAVGYAGKTLDAWLRDKFFEQHVKLFQNRPFIWHIWDGLNDGFAVLINYHKFDQKLLETLIYTYLGDWIKRQKDDINASVDGAQERLAAAESLRKRLIKILEGEAPLDIFVRWKPLDKQPIGWNPDLNDGVRLNIRPFILVDDVKVKGAGVLRNKISSIKWKKDRGKDVESAPWYHLGPQYGGKEGDRINEHHLSLAEKKAARERV